MTIDDDECAGRHYGFTFDLNVKAMKEDGVSHNEVYEAVRVALAYCHFVDHPQGSVHLTRNPLQLEHDEVVQSVQAALSEIAPDFGRYLWRAHLFERWTDMTGLLIKERDAGPPGRAQNGLGHSSPPRAGRRRRGAKAALRRRLGRFSVV